MCIVMAFKIYYLGTSLVVQWLGLHAPKVEWDGEPQVLSLVRELDPTCHS